jgi:glycosyl-4,4'-diaponeurosporenoate acyltransferase
MILYLCIIAAAVLYIAAVVSLAASTAFFPVLGWTALATVLVMLVDAFTATACRLLPKKVANPEKKIFQVSAKEKKFYEKLKIRKWKDKVPEIGQFTGFRKNKLDDPKSVEYLDRFLLEISYGELGHITSCATSFLILLLFPMYHLWLAVAIPVAAVSLLLNLPSLSILRYNSYKLRILRKNNLKKQQLQARKEKEVAITSLAE